MSNPVRCIETQPTTGYDIVRNELKTIYAEIAWYCDPWETINVKKKQGKRFISGDITQLKKTNWQDETNNPASQNHNFWKEVSGDWYFAFENDSLEKVRGYYRLYGALSPPTSGPESWESNEQALGWFNLLTCMTRWLKEEKVGPIKDLFGHPRSLDSEESRTLVFYPNDLRPKRGGGRPFYSILWHPYVDPAYPLEERLTPQNDLELLQETWYLITEEVQKLLNVIQLSPATLGQHDKRNLTWLFKASGAFEAAFLQWYFQELADVKITTCKKHGCKKPVPPGRKRYCSDQCQRAAQQQRYRQTKRARKD